MREQQWNDKLIEAMDYVWESGLVSSTETAVSNGTKSVGVSAGRRIPTPC
jgi:hypothetical protein